MSEYKRITKKGGFTKDLDMTQEWGYSYIYNRLAELEDELESGRLVELPCKVGDPIYTVYLDDDYDYKIAETECIGFNIRWGGIDTITNFYCYDAFRYGKFTTKEAAEARVKALQELASCNPLKTQEEE